MQKYRLTKETLKSLQEEFNNLTNVERVKIIEEIKLARENGDLSENADFEAALNHQKFLEERINEIKTILDNYVIIEEDSGVASKEIVRIGNKVKILEVESGEEFEYEILGSVDNNPHIGRISNESPLAKSILGKKVGDVVEVQNIADPYSIKILKIT